MAVVYERQLRKLTFLLVTESEGIYPDMKTENGILRYASESPVIIREAPVLRG